MLRRVQREAQGRREAQGAREARSLTIRSGQPGGVEGGVDGGVAAGSGGWGSLGGQLGSTDARAHRAADDDDELRQRQHDAALAAERVARAISYHARGAGGQGRRQDHRPLHHHRGWAPRRLPSSSRGCPSSTASCSPTWLHASTRLSCTRGTRSAFTTLSRSRSNCLSHMASAADRDCGLDFSPPKRSRRRDENPCNSR